MSINLLFDSYVRVEHSVFTVLPLDTSSERIFNEYVGGTKLGGAQARRGCDYLHTPRGPCGQVAQPERHAAPRRTAPHSCHVQTLGMENRAETSTLSRLCRQVLI